MALVLKLTVSKAEPVLRGQDHFWRVIRILGEDGRSFTAAQVASVSQEPRISTITGFLRRLTLAGFLSREVATRSPLHGRLEHLYRLERAPEATPIISNDGSREKPRSARQQMWNIMRGPSGRDGFSYVDLVALASTEDVAIQPNTAKTFIQELKATYLVQLDPGGPGRPAVWRLRPAMNSGPLPPMTLRAKLVFDQNRHRISGEVLAEEDTP